jgi:sec-independent protein translocase protein TatB
MFGIGMPEMILILAVALIVLGPKKLPDLAKSLGRALREFKKATSELKESIDVDNELTDVKKTFDEMNNDIREAVDVNIDLDDKAQKISASSNDKKSKKELQAEEDRGPLKDEEK